MNIFYEGKCSFIPYKYAYLKVDNSSMIFKVNNLKQKRAEMKNYQTITK